jgi:hypothetical protein
MMMTMAVCGQAASVRKNSVDIAVLYTADSSNRIPGEHFWMQGGTVQLYGQFWRGLGVVADVTGEHSGAMGTSDIGLDLVTVTFGPRFTWRPGHRKVALFGQSLIGEANALHSVFPTPTGITDSSNSMALKIGGGLNYRISSHFDVRAFEGNWVRTQLPNSTSNVQNHLQTGTGIVFRFN